MLIRRDNPPQATERTEAFPPAESWPAKGDCGGDHGERWVAIGTIDMAVWDAVAKIEGSLGSGGGRSCALACGLATAGSKPREQRGRTVEGLQTSREIVIDKERCRCILNAVN